jgi:alpha-N-acetylglucosaminidase
MTDSKITLAPMLSPFSRLFRVLLLGAAASFVAAAPSIAVEPASPELAAAHALIARVLPDAAERFTCELIPADAGRDVFEYEAGARDTIVLRGNSANSLAVAFNQYLRREAHLDYDWLAVGPLHPTDALPAPAAKLRLTCAAAERFFLNYCTYGYTMPWWDWAQWTRFLDWMAMNGINRPLLQTGQEAVWLDVWQSYGLTRDEVRAYFSAPAHLPWHRMANLDRWGGPLPLSWIERQRDLQKQILTRARALGMRAILPAFAGHVPPQLARLRPAARIVPIAPGWSGMTAGYATHFLDPKDPLFAEIQGRFLARQTELYGSDHLYATDPFNEMEPPDWSPAYLASVADAIYRGMSAADRDARWYQMSWTFTYEKMQGRWTPERLAAMLHAVPLGRMVLLDYAAEEQEFYSRSRDAYGLPFVWNYLGNFGGNTHLSAPLAKIVTLGARALHQPNCIGVGSTLEAMGVNPIAYDLLLELPWEKDAAIDLTSWVPHYADRRAGRSDPAVQAAWQILARDVLRDNSRRRGTYGSVFQGLPPLRSWRGRAQNPQQDYAPAALISAVRQLLRAAAPTQQADGYRYDVVNLTRQILCNLGVDALAQMQAAVAARDAAAFARESGRFLELGRDLDTLLGTRREFLLGSWLADARAWGADATEADYFEANAREILTSWHVPGEQLNDYASRQWNGLVRDYYLPRWEKWVALTAASLARGQAFPEADYIAWVNDRCAQWNRAHDTARYAATPQGDAVAVARALFAKHCPESTPAK